MENSVLDQPVSPEGQYNFDQKVNQLLREGYNFTLGDYISTGHRILMTSLGSYIGYLLIYIISTAIISAIPVVGSIANFIIGSSFVMGFAIVSRKIFYNKPWQFNNFFNGFKFLGPLFAMRLIILLIALIVIIPYIVIALGSMAMDLFRMWQSGSPSDIDPTFIIRLVVKMIPLIIIVALGQALFALAPYIVVFGRKGPWDAIVLSMKIVWKRFLQFILFYIVLFFINVGGAICLIVGLLYTVPLTLCSLYATYEMIVGTNSQDPVLDDMPA